MYALILTVCSVIRCERMNTGQQLLESGFIFISMVNPALQQAILIMDHTASIYICSFMHSICLIIAHSVATCAGGALVNHSYWKPVVHSRRHRWGTNTMRPVVALESRDPYSDFFRSGCDFSKNSFSRSVAGRHPAPPQEGHTFGARNVSWPDPRKSLKNIHIIKTQIVTL